MFYNIWIVDHVQRSIARYYYLLFTIFDIPSLDSSAYVHWLCALAMCSGYVLSGNVLWLCALWLCALAMCSLATCSLAMCSGYMLWLHALATCSGYMLWLHALAPTLAPTLATCSCYKLRQQAEATSYVILKYLPERLCRVTVYSMTCMLRSLSLVV